MAGQRGFFSWWFGELREVFSGRAVPVHALALSAHEVALLEKGVDAPLGVVDTQSEDWLEQIEGLRSRILKRKGRDPLVEVQLPSEQVMFAKVKLSSKGDREQAIKEQLGAITGQDPDTLAFDVAAQADKDGNSVVAIAPSSTVSEAARYAAEWGFTAARVTSIESPSTFRRGPDFRHDEAEVVGSNLPKIAALLALVALIIGGIAAGLILKHRSALSEEAQQQARAVSIDDANLEEKELALAEFAHAAATATDLRDVTMPVWRLIAEAASIMPSDVILTGFEYRAGELILRGTTVSTVALEEALDRSPIFNAPTLSSTSRSGNGRANFVIEAAVDERSIR
jgi:heme exporter protein D